jgi:hypothetical protein
MGGQKYLVECIATFDPKGGIRPNRVKFEDEEGVHVIKVDKVIDQDLKNTFGTMNGNQNKAYTFNCQSIIEDTLVSFKLQYDQQSCKWHMLKVG